MRVRAVVLEEGRGYFFSRIKGGRAGQVSRALGKLESRPAIMKDEHLCVHCPAIQV